MTLAALWRMVPKTTPLTTRRTTTMMDDLLDAHSYSLDGRLDVAGSRSRDDRLKLKITVLLADTQRRTAGFPHFLQAARWVHGGKTPARADASVLYAYVVLLE